MNKRLLIRLILFFATVFPLVAVGQTSDYKVRKCFGFQRDSCPTSSNMYYKVHEESRSALFVLGQTSQTKFTIFNGRDYRVSLCYDPILGSQIGFRLLDSETGNPLYDNKDDNYATEFEFTATQSREIIIEISVPGKSGLSESSGNNEIIFVRKDTEMGCVGVLIEHMITPSKGF
jgi:hypothetical protein